MANDNQGDAMHRVPLYDFPLIYLSYDEPWADKEFLELQKIRPDAKRVQGVKGLNACHVAAAEEAGTDWFITVDADTNLLPTFLGAAIPKFLLSENFLPFWPARNAANGIISGNGSVKLWSRELVHRMRSHEAAPKGRVSMDCDIHLIEPGVTRLLPMPGCIAKVDPTRTAFHAFRAGFRETFFLCWLSEKIRRRGDGEDHRLSQILGIWCNLGRHMPNGLWLLYGARLGYFAAITWRNFDPLNVNDFAWFENFWTTHIKTRIGHGGGHCTLSNFRYDADRLVEEVLSLEQMQDRHKTIPMANIDAAQSALAVVAQPRPILRSPRELTKIGNALAGGIGVEPNVEAASKLFEISALIGDPEASAQFGKLLADGNLKPTGNDSAEAILRSAVELGSVAAPFHLATILKSQSHSEPVESEIESLLDLAAERGFETAEITQ